MSDWNWRRLDETDDGVNVEQQLHEYGCGAACVVMLLADRDIAADQLVVSAGLQLPSTAQDLAERLNEFSRGKHDWVGGALSIDSSLETQHLVALSKRGSWSALLVPDGQIDGHWVVVDGVNDDGTIAVRDPTGTSYRMVEDELLHLMRFMVVVVESRKKA